MRGQAIAFVNLNPPHFELLLLPLAPLPLASAYAVWALLNVAGFAVAAGIVVRRLQLRLSGGPLLLAIGATLAATPVTGWAASAQVTGLVAALFAWIWLALEDRRWSRAAVGIGIAWSLKLLFAPAVIWLLWRRQYRAAAIAVVTGLSCFAVGLAVFGWPEHLAWLHALSSVTWGWYSVNSALAAIPARIVYMRSGALVNPPGLPAATILGLAIAAPVALVGTWRAATDPDASRGWLLLLLTCLLCFPASWIEYWVVLGPPAIACWQARTVRRPTLCAAPAWWVQASWIYPYTSMLEAVTLGSVYTWCLLVWWIGVAWRSAPVVAPARPIAPLMLPDKHLAARIVEVLPRGLATPADRLVGVVVEPLQAVGPDLLLHAVGGTGERGEHEKVKPLIRHRE